MAGAVLEVVSKILEGDCSVAEVGPKFYSISNALSTVERSLGASVSRNVPRSDTLKVADDKRSAGRVRPAGGVKSAAKRNIEKSIR